MARLKGWKGPGKSRTLKSATVTYISRGALVAASWPKKRGRPKSPITRDQNEWFRQANQLAKYADGQALWMAIELSKDSPWYPRDILISAMAGRLFESLNLDGVEFRSVAIRDDVSSDLDFLAGKIKGTIIVRGEDLWQALVPGPPGDVLTSQGPETLPTYAPTSQGSALYWAGNIPQTLYSTLSRATKGYGFTPATNFSVHALGTRINATAGHVYRGSVWELIPSWTLGALKAETADIVAPSTAPLTLHEPLLAPATLEEGTTYAFMWTRRDGADNFKFPISRQLGAIPVMGLPQKYYTPFNGITPRSEVTKANPQTGDGVTIVTSSSNFITATVSIG